MSLIYRQQPDKFRCIGSQSGNSEDPWDVECFNYRQSKAVVSNARHLLSFLVVALLSVLFIILSVASGQTQSLDDEDNQKYSVTISRDAKFLAEDYLEVLEQLRRLSIEYQTYFKQIDSKQAKAYRLAIDNYVKLFSDPDLFENRDHIMSELEVLQQQLEELDYNLEDEQDERGDLSGQIEALNEERDEFEERLDEIWREIDELEAEADHSEDGWDDIETEVRQLEREGSKVESKILRIKKKLKVLEKGYSHSSSVVRLERLSESLQQEVELMSEILEEEIADRFTDELELSGLIDKYVKIAITAAEHSAMADIESYFDFIRSEDGQTWVLELKDLEGINLHNEHPMIVIHRDDDESASVIRVPAVPLLSPAIPAPPYPFFNNDQSWSGGVLHRELSDTFHVSSDEFSIYVVNQSGDLDVVGWDKDFIEARCEYKISARSERKAELLASRIDLRMFQKQQKIYVEPVIPPLTDPDCHLVYGKVQVKIPRHNPVVIKSTFGTARVTDLAEGLRLVAKNCMVKALDIKGGLEVVNSMGSITLRHISGSLDVSNTYGPVEISDSEGRIKIENMYSLVALDDCAGTINLNNSGVTRILGFSGDIELVNQHGPVEVRQVKGDVTARNAYQSLAVEDISGSVDLTNSRGMISAIDIGGQLKATAVYGDVIVERTGGPYCIEASHGTVRLWMDELLQGKSTINVEYCDLELYYDQATNILVDVQVEEGNLRKAKHLGFEYDEDGVLIGTMKIGSGRHPLKITGEHTDIIIKAH